MLHKLTFNQKQILFIFGIAISMIFFIAICIYIITTYKATKGTYSTIKPEYTIELVDETHVLVQTPDTIYKCRLEDIPHIIELDNL